MRAAQEAQKRAFEARQKMLLEEQKVRRAWPLRPLRAPDRGARTHTQASANAAAAAQATKQLAALQDGIAGGDEASSMLAPSRGAPTTGWFSRQSAPNQRLSGQVTNVCGGKDGVLYAANSSDRLYRLQPGGGARPLVSARALRSRAEARRSAQAGRRFPARRSRWRRPTTARCGASIGSSASGRCSRPTARRGRKCPAPCSGLPSARSTTSGASTLPVRRDVAPPAAAQLGGVGRRCRQAAQVQRPVAAVGSAAGRRSEQSRRRQRWRSVGHLAGQSAAALQVRRRIGARRAALVCLNGCRPRAARASGRACLARSRCAIERRKRAHDALAPDHTPRSELRRRSACRTSTACGRRTLWAASTRGAARTGSRCRAARRFTAPR